MTQPSPIPVRVAIACGGTGGHLYPGLAVAAQLRQRGCEITLIVSPKEIDQQAVAGISGMDVLTVPAIGLTRGRVVQFLRGFSRAYLLARRHFREQPPRAALAMGGFTSAPPILAARAGGAGTFLHESNTVPGRANRWLSWFVNRAFVGFPSTAARLHTRKVTITGTPVRPEFAPVEAAACRVALGLDPHQPVVLVMGGSQGASGVNELVMRALPLLRERVPAWQWLHLSGAADLDRVRQTYLTLGLRAVVQPFSSQMERWLGAADCAVSRAGASSLSELAAMRLPALLVPFPAATDDHQLHNANAFVATGAACLLEQRVAAPESFAAMLLELVTNTEARRRMQAALAQRHAPHAAREIAEAILAEISGHAAVPAPAQGGGGAQLGGQAAREDLVPLRLAAPLAEIFQAK